MGLLVVLSGVMLRPNLPTGTILTPGNDGRINHKSRVIRLSLIGDIEALLIDLKVSLDDGDHLLLEGRHIIW
jgi:hypothetical protein